jgi:hypothetical protein
VLSGRTTTRCGLGERALQVLTGMFEGLRPRMKEYDV